MTHDFWQPEFDIETRPDGTIYMRETSALASHLPNMPACLRHWAETAPDRVWLAERPHPGADWVRLSYGEAFEQASRIAHQFLGWEKNGQQLGPDRPVMILSGNSIDHALVMLASQVAAVPGAAVSPGYSLLSDDHGKLRDLAGLLKPGLSIVTSWPRLPRRFRRFWRQWLRLAHRRRLFWPESRRQRGWRRRLWQIGWRRRWRPKPARQ